MDQWWDILRWWLVDAAVTVWVAVTNALSLDADASVAVCPLGKSRARIGEWEAKARPRIDRLGIRLLGCTVIPDAAVLQLLCTRWEISIIDVLRFLRASAAVAASGCGNSAGPVDRRRRTDRLEDKWKSVGKSTSSACRAPPGTELAEMTWLRVRHQFANGLLGGADIG